MPLDALDINVVRMYFVTVTTVVTHHFTVQRSVPLDNQSLDAQILYRTRASTKNQA